MKFPCLILATFLLLGCGVQTEVKKEVKQPNNLQITTLKLIGVKSSLRVGFKTNITVVLKDHRTGMVFEETITCSDGLIKDKLEKYIGKDFKVYETIDIKPKYHGIGETFCIGIYE